jgi:hypothetical protein
MKRGLPFHSRAGFTLIEILVSGIVSTAVGIAVFAFLNAGMFLTAKNLSLNLTSNQMRGALDRVEQVLQQGDTNPVLIDTTGATVASSSAAAGVKLDRYIGGPYVVTTTSGSIGASATTLTITRSTNALASPPLPAVGDIIRIDGTATSLRPRVASTSVGTPDGSLRQAVTVTLASSLGTTVTATSGSVLTSKLVRQVAFIVMTNGAKKELRFYNSIETTTNLNDPTKYTVITDQLATQSADTTPFTIASVSGGNFVNFSLRVRTDTYDNRLRNKQSDEYNTFSRVDTSMRPKVNP